MIVYDVLMLVVIVLMSWGFGTEINKRDGVGIIFTSLLLAILYTGTILFNVYQFSHGMTVFSF
jgi:hypothetical protein